jgi:hypothetical protein
MAECVFESLPPKRALVPPTGHQDTWEFPWFARCTYVKMMFTKPNIVDPTVRKMLKPVVAMMLQWFGGGLSVHAEPIK